MTVPTVWQHGPSDSAALLGLICENSGIFASFPRTGPGHKGEKLFSPQFTPTGASRHPDAVIKSIACDYLLNRPSSHRDEGLDITFRRNLRDPEKVLSDMRAPLTPVVVILAAGLGRRFAKSGGTTHKLDALIGGIPVLEHVLRSVTASRLPFHVVRSADIDLPEAHGIGDSISQGVAATPDAEGWLILPGDLPLVSPHSLLQVAAGLRSHSVVLPFWNGQQGHPVGFGNECGRALMLLRGDKGAAAIVQAYRRRAGDVFDLHLDDPGIALDVDTVEDLATAELMHAALRTH